ncbi:MAG: heavy metal translocating P-type ATPase [Rhodobacteraceae bacterium]|nr:heavy metal translocating P-type ATPase [Paracoccaceae bacterium]
MTATVNRAPLTDAPTHHLVLPGIRCAGCIRTVENTLQARADVIAARVNLSRKRASITAQPGSDPGPWIADLRRAGIEAHETREPGATGGADYVMHLGVAGFAMMNVMLLSVAIWSGAADTTRDFMHWVSAAIALPATVFSARPFFSHAWSALRAGRLNMDVPISLAILLACGMSLYEVIQGGEHAWFDAALALTFFLLIGRVLDQRLRRRARSAADDLAALEPSRVLRIEGREPVRRPIADIRVGDSLWLTAGARVPVDARLESGRGMVDRSFITGESGPVARVVGDVLLAGEIMLTGPATVRVTAVGEDTTLRRVAQLVAMSEGARGRFRSLADRAAEIYTPAVHILAIAAFAGWFLATGELRTAINVAIATLVITCPCALGLAVPAVAVAATSRLYMSGLLLTSDTVLERLAQVDTVVFDKTGTLTKRVPGVPEGLSPDERSVLKALADASGHPICQELSGTLADINPADLADVRELAGDQVTGAWRGIPVRIGRRTATDPTTMFSIGDTVYSLNAKETPLPSAGSAVQRLKALGLATIMMTGDTDQHADAVAAELGIDTVWSGIDAQGKVARVQTLRTAGRCVLMVGDGLNDTAALATADVSIAPGTALDATRNAADVIILSGDLSQIAPALKISRAACRRMKQNFGIAAGYNAIAVPVALLGFATPLAAAVAMSGSSITVVANALRAFRA